MSYTPRLTAPSASDLRWIRDLSGGYNQCIYGSNGPPSVLPNCTGYVHGRVMEIRGVNTDNCGLSFGNAITYWSNSSSDWVQQQDPSLGGIIVYYTKSTGGNPGHVAVIEEIIDNDTVVISESDYGDPDHGVQGTYFRTLTCYRQYGWRPSNAWSVASVGILKNPYVTPTPPPPPPPSSPRKGMPLWMKYLTITQGLTHF